jgi:hypothetical protein
MLSSYHVATMILRSRGGARRIVSKNLVALPGFWRIMAGSGVALSGSSTRLRIWGSGVRIPPSAPLQKLSSPDTWVTPFSYSGAAAQASTSGGRGGDGRSIGPTRKGARSRRGNSSRRVCIGNKIGYDWVELVLSRPSGGPRFWQVDGQLGVHLRQGLIDDPQVRVVIQIEQSAH